MKAFLNHFAFEFKTGIRDKNLLLLNYLFPSGFLCFDQHSYVKHKSGVC